QRILAVGPMRLTRVHVPTELAVGATLALPETAATHLLRVLRLQPNDRCVLFNGDGCDYAARIVTAGKRDATVEILSAHALTNESPLQITLLQSLARGEKMDWILQKATELGVQAFVPVNSERSEVRLGDDRVDKRLAHWRGVVIAACEQSGRAWVPTVVAPQSMSDALDALTTTVRCLLDPEATQAIAEFALPQSRCVLAVGPEGGWSPRDRMMLHAAGFIGLRLGPRILRTETAGIAAIAVLQSRHGDLGIPPD
ncbi:MAG: rRNA ((1498)-N(3))-methyltransferase, partial [Xanthomonadaceae bacterium]|nr:rRNA ((1498)-N(3))-methyltransferase [Xanthomonadaceae bacterium]